MKHFQKAQHGRRRIAAPVLQPGYGRAMVEAQETGQFVLGQTKAPSQIKDLLWIHDVSLPQETFWSRKNPAAAVLTTQRRGQKKEQVSACTSILATTKAGGQAPARPPARLATPTAIGPWLKTAYTTRPASCAGLRREAECV